MISQDNSSGRPLADSKWLENHHNAKLPERTEFAKLLSEFTPKSVVDLGCATGLWLELLDKYLPNDCYFIGIDSDAEALKIATDRSANWNRHSTFMQLDIEENVTKIPAADLTLAFNIFPYIRDLSSFLDTISNRSPRGILAVRQYDGASIRFGPMPTSKRQAIETSLRAGTENSSRFRHYDLDRVFEVLHNTPYTNKSFSFELFERTSPFYKEFIPYYNDMILWTCDHISDTTASYLREWLSEDSMYNRDRYFHEVDLVAILS